VRTRNLVTHEIPAKRNRLCPTDFVSHSAGRNLVTHLFPGANIRDWLGAIPALVSHFPDCGNSPGFQASPTIASDFPASMPGGIPDGRNISVV
jgi:hypothetical protein